VRSEDHSRRQVNSELAGFNPVELKLLLSNDFLKFCSSTERSSNFECSLFNNLDAIDVNCPLSTSFIAPMTV